MQIKRGEWCGEGMVPTQKAANVSGHDGAGFAGRCAVVL